MDKSLQMDKEYENTCVPYECSPKKDLNNQVNKMTSSVDVNQPSPVTLVIAYWVHEQKAMESEWRLCLLSNMNFHTFNMNLFG